MSIGKNIKEKRLKEGLTQEQLAELVFMERSCLSRVELGLKSLKIEEAALIADVFDCSLDDLYYGDGGRQYAARN